MKYMNLRVIALNEKVCKKRNRTFSKLRIDALHGLPITWKSRMMWWLAWILLINLLKQLSRTT